MKTKRITPLAVCIVAAVGFSGAWAIQPDGGMGRQGMMDMQGQNQQPMAERCKAMQQMHDRMIEQMNKDDSQLNDLVAKMDSASGNDKIDAIAAVVKEMVAQRTAHRSEMMRYRRAMLDHMAQHMEASAPEGMQKRMQQWMKNCPVMQQRHGMMNMHGNGGGGGSK